MSVLQRRGVLATIGLAAGRAVSARPASAQPLVVPDGHAAGRDAVPSGAGVPVLPRRPGSAPGFTASLDGAKPKATSGGWAREITSRELPIAANLAMAHLFLNPGGAREMHWHDSVEWAYVIDGRAQVTVVDPGGAAEVFDVGAGDLWYVPRGYPHAIQTLGPMPCHAVLAFNDGLYSEHGTFGLTDLLSRFDRTVVSRELDLPVAALDAMPPGETYIMQGDVLPDGGDATGAERRWPPDRSRGFGLLAAGPAVSVPGGSLHLASSQEFPASVDMTGLLLRLNHGAGQALHWHPGGDEMLYVLAGHARLSLFGADKHLAVADVGPGDCAYIPRNAAHLVEAGTGGAELVMVQNTGTYEAATVSDWLAGAPPQLLANNLRLDPALRAALRRTAPIVGRNG